MQAVDPISTISDDRAAVTAASHQFGALLLSIIVDLKAYGRSLAGNSDAADDLVQETMLRAWAARDRFDPESSIRAWTFTILRNAHYSRWRRTSRETNWDPELDQRTAAGAAQHHAIDLAELHHAMDSLPASQREALLLVGAAGWSYVEAARISECQPGTVKSRVSRARATLLAAEAAPCRAENDEGSRIAAADAYQSIIDEIGQGVSNWEALEAAEQSESTSDAPQMASLHST